MFWKHSREGVLAFVFTVPLQLLGRMILSEELRAPRTVAVRGCHRSAVTRSSFVPQQWDYLKWASDSISTLHAKAMFGSSMRNLELI